jgi:hypothetical protein
MSGDNSQATNAGSRGEFFAENWLSKPEIHMAFHNELRMLDNKHQLTVKQNELMSVSETLRARGILPAAEIGFGTEASSGKFRVVGTEASQEKSGLVVAVVNKASGKAENGSIFILDKDGKFHTAVQNAEKTGYVRDPNDKSGISRQELEQKMQYRRDPYSYY